MTTETYGPWLHYPKLIPYRDYLGQWQWLCLRTERREVFAGVQRIRFDYREHDRPPDAVDDWNARQW